MFYGWNRTTIGSSSTGYDGADDQLAAVPDMGAGRRDPLRFFDARCRDDEVTSRAGGQ
jgi:hypothetical protein